ncbi:GtrA family protein [Paenibacillus apiarius]|uniref:GtrA family protein n=1 Tax=Paenibacillus apiarius TaxID=46240 RepID=A0ABT4DZX5_9BACL|nr:GtrA family protein [Paenibacillus apiarius]MCY9513106.1 GtrA family protein [Paenibacillus apiarius]MCY9521536.1 GtrA family protein [Paenibacillus apiarius]MCY9551690.1 GtrA family protein [Paenibacillus apiarius]MCY9560522.1 GtrA family protein [Paenibacillus apiarius]MCY9685228.1 GtrA family protein [Paenibacillus apiarius]
MRAKIVKYGVVGALGTLLHFSVLILLVEWFGCNPIISSVIGFIIVLIISFFMNQRWTFGAGGMGRMAFIKYVAVSGIGLILNTAIVFVTVDLLQWPYVIGQLCVVAVVPPLNFVLNYYWTFDERAVARLS